MRVSSTASTPQPSARSVARGPAPTRQTWGGVEHANCRHTPVESRRQRTSGFSSEPAAAGLPPLSPVSPRGGARRAVREGQPRAIGAGFGRGGRPQACGQQRGRALEAGQGPRGRAGPSGQGKISRPCAAEPIWWSQRGGDGGRQRRVGVRLRATAATLASQEVATGKGRGEGHGGG